MGQSHAVRFKEVTLSPSVVLVPLLVAALLAIAASVVIGLTRFYMVLAARTWTYADIKPGEPHGPRWYASLNRAYINTLEGLVLFAPAVLIHALLISKTGATHELAPTFAWLFVGARVLYVLAYTATGYKIWISIIWLAQLAGTIGLYALAFGAGW